MEGSIFGLPQLLLNFPYTHVNSFIQKGAQTIHSSDINKALNKCLSVIYKVYGVAKYIHFYQSTIIRFLYVNSYKSSYFNSIFITIASSKTD